MVASYIFKEGNFSMKMNREIPNAILTRTLINNTPTAYIILDEQYKIHYMNEYFMKLRGFTMDQVIGEKCYVLSNGGIPCAQCAIRKAFRTNQKELVTRKDILADGTIRYLDDYAIPLDINTNSEKRYILEIMIDRTEEMNLRNERNQKFNETLTIMSSLLEEKDVYTAEHSYSVKQLSIMLAYEAGLSEKEIWNIGAAASLHDIGKIRISDSIINKPSKLTEEEYQQIKNHPVYSHEILSGLPTFSQIKDIVLYHHERYDGKGYPEGLRGEEIPLGARIIALADTYDAITTTRSYRRFQSHEAAADEIKKNAGMQFDPWLAELFVNMDFNRSTDSLKFKKTNFRVTRNLAVPDEEAANNYDDYFELRNMLNEDELLETILKNTPYGYVLVDKEKKVEYICDHFLEYMQISREEAMGSSCSELCGSQLISCDSCAVSQAMETGKLHTMRQEKIVGDKKKIFDLFAVPIKTTSNGVEHIIEIMIDRTKEIEMEMAFEHDFIALMDSLNNLMKEQEKELDYERMSAKVEDMKKKVMELFIHNKKYNTK